MSDSSISHQIASLLTSCVKPVRIALALSHANGMIVDIQAHSQPKER